MAAQPGQAIHIFDRGHSNLVTQNCSSGRVVDAYHAILDEGTLLSVVSLRPATSAPRQP